MNDFNLTAMLPVVTLLPAGLAAAPVVRRRICVKFSHGDYGAGRKASCKKTCFLCNKIKVTQQDNKHEVI